VLAAEQALKAAYRMTSEEPRFAAWSGLVFRGLWR
jgi:hypothetical protein